MLIAFFVDKKSQTSCFCRGFTNRPEIVQSEWPRWWKKPYGMRNVMMRCKAEVGSKGPKGTPNLPPKKTPER